MTHLVCFGFGYSARALAPDLKERGWKISGTSRTDEGAEQITASGDQGLVFDPEYGCSALRSDAISPLTTATHVLLSAPPGRDGDPVKHFHRDAIAAAPKLEWIGYLSTIGVYGNHNGEWIDETTPTAATSDRSKRRVAAEQEWIEFAEEHGCRVNVFRLAGIYGPGRSAISQLRRGRARRIIKPGQVFNRIHVDDIAQTVLRTIDGGGTKIVYNLSDDEPAPPQDVIAFAAELLGLDIPPTIAFEDAEMSDMARSFYADLKRVRNDRLRKDLGIQLKYPTYREGLSGILEAEVAKNA